MSGPARRFAFGPDLVLEVAGDADATAQLAKEYGGRPPGQAPPPGVDAAVTIAFGALGGTPPTFTGGHKTVGWAVALSDPAAPTHAACLALRGRPRSFAVSLVQGYVVEPLLSIAAARRDTVLLPCAGFVSADGATLLVGRSGAGKTTLMALAAAAGRTVLGDDQVLVAGDGTCRPFPRRMRFYADLPATAPQAFAQLRPGHRAALRGRGVVARLSRGYVAPSLRVPLSALGTEPADAPHPITRVVVLERAQATSDLVAAPLDAAEAAVAALPALEEQRRHLAGASPAWRAAHERALDLERSTLARAVTDARAERIEVPSSWPASRAVAALARRLALAA